MGNRMQHGALACQKQSMRDAINGDLHVLQADVQQAAAEPAPARPPLNAGWTFPTAGSRRRSSVPPAAHLARALRFTWTHNFSEQDVDDMITIIARVAGRL
jgi:hypothetical protein